MAGLTAISGTSGASRFRRRFPLYLAKVKDNVSAFPARWGSVGPASHTADRLDRRILPCRTRRQQEMVSIRDVREQRCRNLRVQWEYVSRRHTVPLCQIEALSYSMQYGSEVQPGEPVEQRQ